MLKNKSNKKQKKSRQEINDASWELKRKRKHKGLPSGSRFNGDLQSKTESVSKSSDDPRIGSKKPIALVITQSELKKKEQIKEPTIHTEKKSLQATRALLPEQELEQLENDDTLEKLLDLVEQDVKLTPEQQHYLDSKLDRIDELMQQLGYLDDDSDEVNNKKEDIVGLLKRK